jgi:hypothetical protein
VKVLCWCVFDWQRLYVVVPAIYLPCNLFSFVAVICKLYTISCSVSIIREPFLSNSLTFHDAINISTSSNPSFFGLIRDYSSILSIIPLRGVGFIPISKPSLLLGLGPVRNQQMRPTRILGVFTCHWILLRKWIFGSYYELRLHCDREAITMRFLWVCLSLHRAFCSLFN